VAEPIGELLRKERNARGLTLVEISDATKIRVRYLRALETEDWDVMPAPAYSRGFLRTYATFLGLDADAIVEEYRRSVELAAPEPRPSEHPTPLPPAGGRGRRLGPGAIALAALVAILVIIYLVGVFGGGNGGKHPNRAATASRHRHRPHHHRHRQSSTPPATPSQASVELRPTAAVWVCLVDESGKPLVDGEVLNPGDSRGPFRAAAFELNLGNGAVEIRADGDQLSVPDSPNPIGFRITPSGATPLDTGSRPTCA
jgi:cytoskeleton protein RodZ